MSKFKKNSVGHDSVLVFILFLGVLVPTLFGWINFSFDLDSFSSILIGLFGTLLGFILTAFTILFMFDTDKNPTLKKIKQAGLFNQIHERFITTIAVTFVALLFTLFYLVFSKFVSSLFFLDLALIYLSGLVFIRVYRSLKILYLIYKTL